MSAPSSSEEEYDWLDVQDFVNNTIQFAAAAAEGGGSSSSSSSSSTISTTTTTNAADQKIMFLLVDDPGMYSNGRHHRPMPTNAIFPFLKVTMTGRRHTYFNRQMFTQMNHMLRGDVAVVEKQEDKEEEITRKRKWGAALLPPPPLLPHSSPPLMKNPPPIHYVFGKRRCGERNGQIQKLEMPW